MTHRRFWTGGAIAAVALGLLAGCGSSDTNVVPEEAMLSPETLENVARMLWLPKYDASLVPDSIRQQLVAPKNLPAAFGERNRAWMDSLLADPDSCTPDYSQRYATLKEFSGSLSPHQAYSMSLLMGKDSSTGYEPMPAAKAFRFPADDAPANKMQVGWHFYVGSAWSKTGEEFGVQLMFWHYAMLPPAMAAAKGLTDQENQALEMHLAISRAGGRHYRAKPYVVAGTTGLVQFSEAPYTYTVGKNTVQSRQKDALFPLDLKAWGLDEAGSRPVEMAVNLGLGQTKPYMFNGDQGLSPACGGVGTLYYSVPRLHLEPGSSLQLGDEKIELASGTLWYDHQYGTGFMPDGNPRSDVIRTFSNLNALREDPSPGGWEWLMMQLDDGTEFALAALHSNENKSFYGQTGAQPPGVMTAAVNGKFNDQKGVTHEVKGHLEVAEWIKSTVAYAPYRATGIWYPQEVKVVIDQGVPTPRTVRMRPIVDSGQQGWFATGLQYSEGAVYLENEQGERIGRGFLESTGWDLGLQEQQIFALAGMPDNARTRRLAVREKLDSAQASSCFDWLTQPAQAQRLDEEMKMCKGL